MAVGATPVKPLSQRQSGPATTFSTPNRRQAYTARRIGPPRLCSSCGQERALPSPYPVWESLSVSLPRLASLRSLGTHPIRPARRRRLVPHIHHEHLVSTKPRERARKHQARRAGADDGDVVRSVDGDRVVVRRVVVDVWRAKRSEARQRGQSGAIIKQEGQIEMGRGRPGGKQARGVSTVRRTKAFQVRSGREGEGR